MTTMIVILSLYNVHLLHEAGRCKFCLGHFEHTLHSIRSFFWFIGARWALDGPGWLGVFECCSVSFAIPQYNAWQVFLMLETVWDCPNMFGLFYPQKFRCSVFPVYQHPVGGCQVDLNSFSKQWELISRRDWTVRGLRAEINSDFGRWPGSPRRLRESMSTAKDK